MWFNRHKNLTIAISVVLAGLIMIAAVLMPMYQNVVSVSKKITTKSIELESLRSKVSILSKLDPAVLQERVTTLDKALPVKKDVLLYLTAVDRLSSELSLTFGGISLSPGDVTEASSSAKKNLKAQTGLQTLATQIKMSGTQESIFTFLRTIENVLPLMQIKDIKVGILGTNQLSLSLSLGMLWAPNSQSEIKGQVTLFDEEEDKIFNQLAEYRNFEAMTENVESTPDITKIDLFSRLSTEIASPAGEIIPLQ